MSQNRNEKYNDFVGNCLSRRQYRVYQRILRKVYKNLKPKYSNSEILRIESHASSLARSFNPSKEYRKNFHTTITPNGTFKINIRKPINNSLEKISVR